MLVVCNGSPKSGSTWLVQIISACTDFKVVPSKFQNSDWSNPSISKKYGQRLNQYGFYLNEHYYCKQHWEEPWAYEVAKNPKVLFLNIVRDIRDMMVSRYFHDIRKGSFSGSIENYFEKGIAQRKLQKYINYHRFWHGNGQEAFCYLTSYEALSADFHNSVEHLFNRIGLWSGEEISKLVNDAYEASRFDKKEKIGDGQFFRKGQVGDFENHLQPWMIQEIYAVAKDSDYLSVKQNMQKHFPAITEYLRNTDVGL